MSTEADVYRNALRFTLAAIGVLVVAGVIVGYLVDGTNGVVAALVGVGVAAITGVTTQVAMLYGHRMSGASMMGIFMGSWLVKIIIIIGVLVVVREIDGFNRPVFAVFALVGIALSYAIDFWVLRRARLTYVDSSSKPDSE